jgi:hypothetical protein
LLCAVVGVCSDVSSDSGDLLGHKNLSHPNIREVNAFTGRSTALKRAVYKPTVHLHIHHCWPLKDSSLKSLSTPGISSALLPFHSSDWPDFTQISHIADVLLSIPTISAPPESATIKMEAEFYYFTPKRLNTQLPH